MGYDISEQTEDFENITLDEFGEMVTYTPFGGSARSIQAVIYRSQNASFNLPDASFNPGRVKIIIKISQSTTSGIQTIQKGKDTVKFKLEPDDPYDRTLTVLSANVEYGTWMLGLG